MRTTAFVVAIAALLALAVGAGLVATAEGEYDLTVVDAIDTPEKTVEYEKNEYVIDEMAVIEPGDPIEMSVTSSETYTVVLYDTDQQNVHSERRTADVTEVTMGDDENFDTASLDPGTYMLALEPGSVEAVTPLVVQGYDIELEYSTTATEGSDLQLNATVEPIDDLDQPDVLEVAIWDEDVVEEFTLEHAEGTHYETTESLEKFDPGTYDVYGSVTGDEMINGYPVALAVESGSSLTVTADEGDDDDNESDTGDSSDGNETDDDTGGDGSVADDAGDEKEMDEGGVDEDDETNDNDTASDDDEAIRDDDEKSGDDSTDDETDNVIEPTETNDTATDKSSPDDGLGTSAAVPALIAIIAVVLLGIKQNST